MIEEYVHMDQRYDIFYERFMEKRHQKLNNSKQPGMEDSHPFPTEPVRAALYKLPRKRVSNTSSDLEFWSQFSPRSITSNASNTLFSADLPNAINFMNYSS